MDVSNHMEGSTMKSILCMLHFDGLGNECVSDVWSLLLSWLFVKGDHSLFNSSNSRGTVSLEECEMTSYSSISSHQYRPLRSAKVVA